MTSMRVTCSTRCCARHSSTRTQLAEARQAGRDAASDHQYRTQPTRQLVSPSDRLDGFAWRSSTTSSIASLQHRQSARGHASCLALAPLPHRSKYHVSSSHRGDWLFKTIRAAEVTAVLRIIHADWRKRTRQSKYWQEAKEPIAGIAETSTFNGIQAS